MTVKAAKIAHPTMLPSTTTAIVSQSPSLRTMPSAPRAQLIGAMLAPAQIHICCGPVESLSASGMGSMLWTSTLSSDPAAVAMRASSLSGVVRSHRVVRNEVETPARYCAGDADAVKTDGEPRVAASPELLQGRLGRPCLGGARIIADDRLQRGPREPTILRGDSCVRAVSVEPVVVDGQKESNVAQARVRRVLGDERLLASDGVCQRRRIVLGELAGATTQRARERLGGQAKFGVGRAGAPGRETEILLERRHVVDVAPRAIDVRDAEPQIDHLSSHQLAIEALTVREDVGVHEVDELMQALAEPIPRFGAALVDRRVASRLQVGGDSRQHRLTRSTRSGRQSPMSCACETTRAPRRSSRCSFGRSSRFASLDR